MCEQAPLNKKIDNAKYYDILGVSKHASPKDFKMAYIRGCAKNHPDKEKDPTKFIEIAKAYHVLSDPEKRQLYDQYGQDAVKVSISDIISPFSGGNDDVGVGSFVRRRKKLRGQDVVHYLKVSLEDLYNGISKRFSVTRNVLCSNCNGKGTKSGASMTCHACQGSGIKVSERQLGPNIIHKMQHCCNVCKGTGEFVNDDDRCVSCNGEKVVIEKKVLEVHVEKGMQIGEKIILPGETDESPDTITGDIVFVLQEKDHP